MYFLVVILSKCLSQYTVFNNYLSKPNKNAVHSSVVDSCSKLKATQSERSPIKEI